MKKNLFKQLAIAVLDAISTIVIIFMTTYSYFLAFTNDSAVELFIAMTFTVCGIIPIFVILCNFFFKDIKEENARMRQKRITNAEDIFGTKNFGNS